MLNNKDKLVKNIITTFLLLLILIIEGCFNFVSLSFDFIILSQIQFWIKIAFKIVMLLIVRALALNIFMVKARDNNKELQLEKSKNEKLVKLKDADFPYWVENIKNKEIKIEAWKEKINKKLARLEKKAKEKDIHIFYDNTISEEEKLKNKYYSRKMRFLALLSNDFIEGNINTLQVKFQRLNSAIFDLPVNLETDNKKYQITSKSRNATIASLAAASVGLLAFNIIFNGLDFSKNNAVLIATLLSLAVDMVFLLYQFFMGILDSYRIINTNELLPYINRNRILKEYLYYKKPDEKSRIDIIFDQLNNTPQ